MVTDYVLQLFVLPLTVSAIVALLLAPLVIAVYRRQGWVDDPKKQTHAKVIHKYPVPRGGGLVIFGALLASSVLFLGLDKHSLCVLLGALLLTITGVLDDIFDLNPYVRLGFGVFAACMVVMSGIGIPFISNPLGEGVIHLNQPQIALWLFGKTRTIWLLADVLAIVWIVWCMNIINWSKGLDGQLPGIVVIAAVVIAILSFRFTEDVTQWSVSILAAITAGAFLGFLPWNFFPQKMMPGYGAGSLAGYLLAVLSILSGAKLATLIIVLAVPMIDAFYVVIRRLLHKRSPVWGDRSHFHHLLLDLGWSKRTVALFYWLITALLGFLALRLNAEQKAFTILVLLFAFGALLVWVQYLITSSKRPDHGNGSKT